MNKITLKKITPVFTDARGAIFDILNTEVRHVGLITFSKGAVRGNHYHKIGTQYTYVLKGKVELKVKNLEEANSVSESIIMVPGDLVEIPPMIAHAYTAIEESTIVDLTTTSRADSGYENDTVRTKI